jgi:hypothetical protein
MSVLNRGKYIEDHIKSRYSLKDSKLGFDGNLNGLEIEIKGCIPIHKNGVSVYGKDRITKGRFWIDNRAHKLLLAEKGLYIFVVYKIYRKEVFLMKILNLFAFEIDFMINGGDNTKIRYDRIFDWNEYKVSEWIKPELMVMK